MSSSRSARPHSCRSPTCATCRHSPRVPLDTAHPRTSSSPTTSGRRSWSASRLLLRTGKSRKTCRRRSGRARRSRRSGGRGNSAAPGLYSSSARLNFYVAATTLVQACRSCAPVSPQDTRLRVDFRFEDCPFDWPARLYLRRPRSRSGACLFDAVLHLVRGRSRWRRREGNLRPLVLPSLPRPPLPPRHARRIPLPTFLLQDSYSQHPRHSAAQRPGRRGVQARRRRVQHAQASLLLERQVRKVAWRIATVETGCRMREVRKGDLFGLQGACCASTFSPRISRRSRSPQPFRQHDAKVACADDVDGDAALKLAAQVHGVRCPKCHRVVERNGGCPHVCVALSFRSLRRTLTLHLSSVCLCRTDLQILAPGCTA